jgi:hypothetical protein
VPFGYYGAAAKAHGPQTRDAANRTSGTRPSVRVSVGLITRTQFPGQALFCVLPLRNLPNGSSWF